MLQSNKLFVLGPAGTYGHEAALRFFQSKKEIIFFPNMVELLRQVNEQKCFGVVPIENSSAGPVMEVVRTFWMQAKEKFSISVIGEIQIPIRHNLLVRLEVNSAKDLSEVISHPQALAQCNKSLGRLGISIRKPATSTATAAEEISENSAMVKTAAIAPSFAAEIYGLKVLQPNLQDFSGNVTRFHVVGPCPAFVTGNDKTAMIFHLPNEAGSLLRVLSIFASQGVNMSSLHSIPLGDNNFKYAFYCEIECHGEDATGKSILAEMKKLDENLLILGSFPRTSLGERRRQP